MSPWLESIYDEFKRRVWIRSVLEISAEENI
jgi:hypothetical protein